MKVLIVCTSMDSNPANNGSTGAWLGELVNLYDVFRRRRILLEFASCHGGKVPIDERSTDTRDEYVKHYQTDTVFQRFIHNTIPLEEIDFREYRAICLVGGLGAIWEFPEQIFIQHLVRNVYESNGIVTAVGYGVAGLLNVTLSDGTPLLQGKYVTGISKMEELLSSFSSQVPYHLEERLVELGANYTHALLPYTEHIELDERLITAQNSGSARKLAQKLTEELYEK